MSERQMMSLEPAGRSCQGKVESALSCGCVHCRYEVIKSYQSGSYWGHGGLLALRYDFVGDTHLRESSPLSRCEKRHYLSHNKR